MTTDLELAAIQFRNTFALSHQKERLLKHLEKPANLSVFWPEVCRLHGRVRTYFCRSEALETKTVAYFKEVEMVMVGGEPSVAHPVWRTNLLEFLVHWLSDHYPDLAVVVMDEQNMGLMAMYNRNDLSLRATPIDGVKDAAQ